MGESLFPKVIPYRKSNDSEIDRLSCVDSRYFFRSLWFFLYHCCQTYLLFTCHSGYDVRIGGDTDACSTLKQAS